MRHVVRDPHPHVENGNHDELGGVVRVRHQLEQSAGTRLARSRPAGEAGAGHTRPTEQLQTSALEAARRQHMQAAGATERTSMHKGMLSVAAHSKLKSKLKPNP